MFADNFNLNLQHRLACLPARPTYPLRTNALEIQIGSVCVIFFSYFLEVPFFCCTLWNVSEKAQLLYKKYYLPYIVFLYGFFACRSRSCGFAILFCLVSLCLESDLRRAWYRQCTAEHKLLFLLHECYSTKAIFRKKRRPTTHNTHKWLLGCLRNIITISVFR